MGLELEIESFEGFEKFDEQTQEFSKSYLEQLKAFR
jgi:hypothetical protein